MNAISPNIPTQTIVVVFSGELEHCSERAVLWESTVTPQSQGQVWSLPLIINGNRESWRQRYLDWALDVTQAGGQANKNRQLAAAMALAVDQPFEAHSIAYTLMRFWALCQIVEKEAPTTLILNNPPFDVERAMQDWAGNRGIDVTVSRTGGLVTRNFHRLLFRASESTLLQLIRGCARLLEYGTICLLNGRQSTPSQDDSSPVVITYRRTPARKTLEERRAYWGYGDHELFPRNTRWIDIPTNSGRLRGRLLDRARLSTSIFELPSSMDALRVWKSWIEGCRSSWEWRSQFNGQRRPEWPLARRWYRDARWGADGADNAFWRALFEGWVARSASTGPCFYLAEMQGWELALMSAWLDYGARPLVSVQHSTVGFWDTRYAVGAHFVRSRLASCSNTNFRLAANGAPARRNLEAAGYPKTVLVEVEALRFMSGGAFQKSGLDFAVDKSLPAVLVCGEYDLEATKRLINVAVEGRERLLSEWSFYFRAHPATPQSAEYALAKGLLDDPVPTERELRVVCGAVSSIAIDAVLAGISPILVMDARALPGPAADVIPAITSGAELSKCLQGGFGPDQVQEAMPAKRPAIKEAWFHLEPGLERWRTLIEWSLDKASI